MSDEPMVRQQRGSLVPAAVAALGTVLAAIVAVIINLVTSGWNAPLFAVLVALVAISAVLPFIGAKADNRTERRAWAREARHRRALRLADLRGQFQARGRGLIRAGTRRGWYFTGRTRALTELVGWITDPSDNRPRLVTGEPGSGKSAVLGRVVTLAHADLRAEVPDAALVQADPGTVPPSGSVKAAVNARGMTADEVAAVLGGQLGLGSPPAPEFLERLAGPAVVVVDAVDEAADPAELVREVLEPLASSSQRTGVRLLAGLRPGLGRRLVRQFGAQVVELDLDAAEYARADDIAEYVFKLLTDEGDEETDFRDRPEAARAVAAVVAARAGKSFLIAQLTVLALASAGDVGQADESCFPDTVGAAMDGYLDRFGDDRGRIRDLLIPLALAEGDGIADRRAWTRLATEYGARTYTDQDITWLLRDTSAPDVLHRTAVDGRYAYGLCHQALNEYLRGIAEAERPAEDLQRRFAETLVELAGGDWIRADRYTREHLATHAAAGGVLDALLEDPGFLIEADPPRLLQALPAVRTRRGRELSFVLQRAAFGLLRTAPAQRSSYLELAARKCGQNRLADAVAARLPDRPWSVPWAHWARITCENRLLGHVAGYVRTLTIVDNHRRPVVVAAGDYEIRAWHLDDGTPYCPAITGFAASIEGLTAVPRPTGVEVRTWHDDETTQRWYLRMATPLGEAKVTPDKLAGANGGVVVTQAEETLRLRDHASYEQLGDDLLVPGLDRVLAVKEVDGRLLTILRLGDRRAQMWDLTGRRPLGAVLEPLADADPVLWAELWSGAVFPVDERPVAALGQTWSSAGEAKVTFWDPAEARPLAESMVGQQIGAMSVAVLESGARRIVCAGGADGRLVCREWSAREPDGRPFLAHDGGIDALTGTGETLVSGGRDGAVRVWTLPDVATAPRGRDVAVSDMAAVDGLFTGLSRTDGSLTTWDAETGEVLARWTAEQGGRSNIAALAIAARRLVAAGTPGGLAFWDAATGEPAHTLPVALPDGHKLHLSTGWLGGSTVLLATAPGGRALLWDARTGTPQEFTCAPAGPWGAFAQINDEPYIVSWPKGTEPPGLWRIPSGEPAPTRFQPCAHEHHHAHPDVLTVGVLDDHPVAVGVGPFSSVDVWDLRTGDLLRTGQLRDGHDLALNTTAIGVLNDRQVAVSAGYAGTVIVWDLDGVREVIHTGAPFIGSLAIVRERRIIAGGLTGVLAIEATSPVQ